MPSSWKSADVRCPFYKHDANAKVRCEGIIHRTSVMLCFWSVDEKNVYMDEFCIQDYTNCELFKTIMKKYDEV